MYSLPLPFSFVYQVVQPFGVTNTLTSNALVFLPDLLLLYTSFYGESCSEDVAFVALILSSKSVDIQNLETTTIIHSLLLYTL